MIPVMNDMPCNHARKAGLESCVSIDGLACACAYIDVLERLLKYILTVDIPLETREKIEV